MQTWTVLFFSFYESLCAEALMLLLLLRCCCEEPLAMHRHSLSGYGRLPSLLLLREKERAKSLCCGTEPQCLRKQRLNGLSRRKVSWEVNTLHTPRVTSSTVTYGKYSVSYRRPVKTILGATQ